MGAVLEEVPNLKKMLELPIIDPTNPSKKYSEKEEKWLREVKTYEFINVEESGMMQRFPYGTTRNKMDFTLLHGGRYKLPRFIARHLESCTTPIWKWRPDGHGGIHKELVGRKPRFQMREVYE